MSNRVTSDEVKEIINTEITVDPFITAANLIVTNKLGSSALGDELLKEIERWLSAHLVAVSDKRISQESMGDASVKFDTNKKGLGLDSTEYGQQVKLLDTTGTLSKLGLKKPVFNVMSEGD
ncbi:MAG: hypothetical protein ACQEQF_00410 [Bacillota bacterium]